MPPSIANLLAVLVGAIVLVVLGFVGGVKYEKGQEARAIVKEVKSEETQHGKDVGTVAAEGATFNDQVNKPLDTPAPVIRVCRSPAKVPPTPASGPETHDTGPVRADNTESPPAVEWDSAPVVLAGRNADAQIAGLQDYIVRVCRPKP